MSKSNRHPLTWTFRNAPVDRSVMAAVEQHFGIVFPTDYVDCALQNHGGYPTPDCYDMTHRREAVFSHLLSLNDSVELDKNMGMLETYDAVKDRLPAKVFPFGADPFGNLLCFDYRGATKGNPKCVFWDHEKAFDDPEGAIFFISDSFTELLNLLYTPK